MGLLDFFRKKAADAAPPAAAQAKRLASVGRRPPRRSFDLGGASSVTEGWPGRGSRSINEDLRARLLLMRKRSRDLAQNNDYAKRFKRLCITNIVGPKGVGMQAQARNPDGALDVPANERIEEGWKQWGRRGSCEITGMLSWVDVQRMCAGTVPEDGEILVLLVEGQAAGNPEGLALQVLEPDALPIHLNRELPNGNRIVMGVEVTPAGRPVAYWLSRKRDAYHSLQEGDYVRFPAEKVIHLFVPEYPNQLRGIPWFHSAGVRLNQIGAYEVAEVVAARLGAAKMGFFTPSESEEYEGEGEDDDGDIITEAEPGVFEKLPPGVQLQTWDPQHPNANFDKFVKRELMGVAAGLGVSYPTLASDLEGVSYSSGRLGTLDERDMWMFLQDWFAETLCQRVFEAWLPRALLSGTVQLPLRKLDKFSAVRWQPRRWAWVDPLKDMVANEKAVKLRIKSRRQIVEENGGDFDQTIAQLEQEEKALKEKGLLPPDKEVGNGKAATG
ncbi:phage portal protein [Deferrisoma camini]|uniref:phage portal protein n=1 Tax=Deferrisoma camini TaxID=1035120 RepID=UPI0004B4144A|nr:phage portal protein [Deferrisoma camini]